MRIESLINPAIPLKILNEQTDHNEDLTGKDGLSDRNLALSDKAKRLLKKKDRPAKNEGAVVTISDRGLNKNIKGRTVLSSDKDFKNRIYRSEDHLFIKLHAAYGILDQRDYKGNYINKFI
jgi:hypothetical protein